jgi:hypothetical protein
VTYGLAIMLPPEAIEAIARRAAELVREELGASPWMTRQQTAAYLGVPVSRLEKDRTIPSRKWEGRVLYNRHELDQWFERFRQ